MLKTSFLRLIIEEFLHFGKVRSTHRVYDTAQIPYQRVLKSGILTKTTEAQLASTYAHLNPVRLLKQINDNVKHLWQLRERHPGEIIKQGESR